MPVMIDLDGELMDGDMLTNMYSQGNYPPCSYANHYKLVKTLWEHNGAVRDFNQDENFNGWFNKFKTAFPNTNKMKYLRMICIFMLVKEGIIETVPDETYIPVGPVDKWLIELLKDGFKPTQEIVETLVRKHLEDQETRLDFKVLQAIDHIVYEATSSNKEAFWKRALDICWHYKSEDRVEGMLDAFSEALQDYYEKKLEVAEGNIIEDAKWMKELYANLKMIYEATSVKKKKKTRRSKKKKAPSVPPAPSLETIISTGNEVIVWDGGDIYEEIVLVKGVF